jgi:quercetin dioxygenase-like cupin family protein
MNKLITFAVGIIVPAFILAGTVTTPALAQAQKVDQRPTRTLLQKSDVGTTGREATLQIVEFAAGSAEIPHSHPGELIAYVLEGAFELNVTGKPVATHRAGDSFIIEGGRVHAGKNITAGPTRKLVTVILEKGKPSTTPAK